MDKKNVGITLILTALFVVGGVVLETHGGNEYVNKSSGACGSFQGWSFDTGTRRYTAEN